MAAGHHGRVAAAGAMLSIPIGQNCRAIWHCGGALGLKSFSVGRRPRVATVSAPDSPRGNPAANATIRNSVSVLSHPVDPRRTSRSRAPTTCVISAVTRPGTGGRSSEARLSVPTRWARRRRMTSSCCSRAASASCAICARPRAHRRPESLDRNDQYREAGASRQPNRFGDSRQLLSNCLV